MKKTLALILALALAVTALNVGATVCAAGDYTVGSVTYSGGSGSYYYSDKYFEQPASLYNASLATMSIYASLAGDGVTRITETLTSIGFKNIKFNDDYRSSGIDTMGTIIAHKTIKANGSPYTLIIVDTRPGTAMTEWAGNFTIGENGNHKGFNLAAEEIFRSLNAYVAEYSDTFESNAIKIWTMGFSRSAASSNLFAAKLTDEVRDDMKVDAWDDKFTLTAENIYAYTFETPVGGSTDNVSAYEAEANYTNIHNIINPADLVTMVAPAEWGFVRYGVDENIIPASNTERYDRLYNEMLKRFIAFGGSNVESQTVYDENGAAQHILSTFTGKKLAFGGIDDTDITIEAFLDGIFTELTTAIGSRSNYAADIETAARSIISYACANLDMDLITAFADSLEEKIDASYDELFVAALAGEDELYDVMYSLASEASAETGFDLFSVPELKNYIDILMPYAANVIAADVLYSHGEMLLTLLNGISTAISAHYPELCVAWLECQDTNYNPDAESAVPEYCVYEKETAAKVGNYTMTLNGVSKNITLTGNSSGFSLYSTADGKYIGLSGNSAVLTDTPYCWYYNGGFYASTRSTRLLRLISKYGKTYLTFNADGFGTSSSKNSITITEAVRSTDHTAAYTRNDNQSHTVTCANCKAIINSCTAHTYSGDSCACGQISPEAAAVNGVSVSSTKIFRLFSSSRKVTISANAKYAVTEIQYSLDGGSTWKSGSTFTVKKSVPDFQIKTTDAAGNVAVWAYNAASDAATRL